MFLAIPVKRSAPSPAQGEKEWRPKQPRLQQDQQPGTKLWNCMCENVQIIVSVGFSLSDPTQSNENRKGPRANAKSGAHNIDCGRGVWGHAPRKF